jgi:vacuolar protein-sorting-associated protein 4
MFKLNLGDTPYCLSEQEFSMMGGAASEGYSGSDIAVVVREALMEPLRKCQTAKQFMVDAKGDYHPCVEYPNCPYCPMQLSSAFTSAVTHATEGGPQGGDTCRSCGAVRMSLYAVPSEKLVVPVITYADFEKALTRTHSSVGVDELQRFVSWTEEFGQEG